MSDLERLPDENDFDHFERVAELFRRETGYLRPGKDCRLHSPEERMNAWLKWLEQKIDEAHSASDVSGRSMESGTNNPASPTGQAREGE